MAEQQAANVQSDRHLQYMSFQLQELRKEMKKAASAQALMARAESDLDSLTKETRRKLPHEHDELDRPDYVSADGTYMTQSVVIPYADGENEGAEIELTYEAKILQDWHRVEALDFDEEVEGLTCADGLLTIHFASDEIAQQKVSWS